MADKTLVIASNYTQFCTWCNLTERKQTDYHWVGTSVSLHGVEQGTKVIWLTPWLAGGSEAALDKYDELLAAVRAYELDVEYIRC
jgi:hypothetical protein